MRKMWHSRLSLKRGAQATTNDVRIHRLRNEQIKRIPALYAVCSKSRTIYLTLLSVAVALCMLGPIPSGYEYNQSIKLSVCVPWILTRANGIYSSVFNIAFDFVVRFSACSHLAGRFGFPFQLNIRRLKDAPRPRQTRLALVTIQLAFAGKSMPTLARWHLIER